MVRARARWCFPVALLAVGLACGQSPAATQGTYVRGIESQLPVYATTNAPREAAAWLPGGTVLPVLGKFEEAAWVPVAAPDEVSVWIYRDLIRDGAVVASKSQVRSGAGMAFRPVAHLDRGTPVEIRGVYGDWLKIKPPPGTVFWVLRNHVEPLAEWPGGDGAGQAAPDIYAALIEALTNGSPAAAQTAPDVPPLSVPPDLSEYVLDDSARQGERVTLTGTLDWGGVDAATAPFCLVAREQNGDAIPLCNLLAPEITYRPCVSLRVTVEGTRWIVKGMRLPFVVPLAVQEVTGGRE